MDPNTFPTKGNLILAKNALALSKQGFDLMDKKRNILIRELMELISEASDIQNQIDETFSNAYQALQKANPDGNPSGRTDCKSGSGGKLHPYQTSQCHGDGDPESRV